MSCRWWIEIRSTHIKNMDLPGMWTKDLPCPLVLTNKDKLLLVLKTSVKEINEGDKQQNLHQKSTLTTLLTEVLIIQRILCSFTMFVLLKKFVTLKILKKKNFSKCIEKAANALQAESCLYHYNNSMEELYEKNPKNQVYKLSNIHCMTSWQLC